MPQAALKASIWDLNRMQAFATVFLSRDTIIPLIFGIRALVLL
jgi:hypothetical protein